MQYFLVKTDPDSYSIEDFKKEGVATWNGVRNAQAVAVLKAMKKGDKVLMYHSQGEGSIRGLGKVIGNSRPDPKDAKSWLVDFAFVKEFSAPYATIGDIRSSGKFSDFVLLKQPRLSTMLVPPAVIAWLKARGVKV